MILSEVTKGMPHKVEYYTLDFAKNCERISTMGSGAACVDMSDNALVIDLILTDDSANNLGAEIRVKLSPAKRRSLAIALIESLND